VAVLAAGLLLAGPPAKAQLVPENFACGRVSDLAALCAAGPTDPNVVAAVHFCHGVLASTGQFHTELTRMGGIVKPFFCLPSPLPTISDITAGFFTRSRANPQFAGSPAVEGVVRQATTSAPCPPSTPAARGRRAA